jgi:DNA gyrase subunit A
MQDREQFILTVCANGYGKVSSAYEYRRTNRGGQGITNIDRIDRNGAVVASFPVRDGNELMLVTDQAKMIRLPVELRSARDDQDGGLRVLGRSSAGVRLFNVADNEHVVSAALIEEPEDQGEADAPDVPEAETPTPE